MVIDFLFWIVPAFIITMLFIWSRMYEILKNKVNDNYQSLCEIEKTIGQFGKILNKVSDDIVEIKDINFQNILYVLFYPFHKLYR